MTLINLLSITSSTDGAPGALRSQIDPRLPILMDIFCPLSIHLAFFLRIMATYRPIELDILMRREVSGTKIGIRKVSLFSSMCAL